MKLGKVKITHDYLNNIKLLGFSDFDLYILYRDVFGGNHNEKHFYHRKVKYGFSIDRTYRNIVIYSYDSNLRVKEEVVLFDIFENKLNNPSIVGKKFLRCIFKNNYNLFQTYKRKAKRLIDNHEKKKQFVFDLFSFCFSTNPDLEYTSNNGEPFKIVKGDNLTKSRNTITIKNINDIKLLDTGKLLEYSESALEYYIRYKKIEMFLC